jgi:hypothetical protein
LDEERTLGAIGEELAFNLFSKGLNAHMKKTARHKLNAATFNGILIVAGLAALLLQSWKAFVLVAIVLAVSAWSAGDIRIHGNSDRH